MAADTLVIGYGNTLRGDDGIGPAVAREIAESRLPGVRTFAVHQLTPELAADLAIARRVVFVDSAITGDEIELCRLSPGRDQALAHVLDPRVLLALTLAAYNRCPEAWLMTLPGEDFSFREGLSELGRARARAAVERVKQMLETGM